MDSPYFATTRLQLSAIARLERWSDNEILAATPSSVKNSRTMKLREQIVNRSIVWDDERIDIGLNIGFFVQVPAQTAGFLLLHLYGAKTSLPVVLITQGGVSRFYGFPLIDTNTKFAPPWLGLDYTPFYYTPGEGQTYGPSAIPAVIAIPIPRSGKDVSAWIAFNNTTTARMEVWTSRVLSPITNMAPDPMYLPPSLGDVFIGGPLPPDTYAWIPSGMNGSLWQVPEPAFDIQESNAEGERGLSVISVDTALKHQDGFMYLAGLNLNGMYNPVPAHFSLEPAATTVMSRSDPVSAGLDLMGAAIMTPMSSGFFHEEEQPT